MQNKAIAIFGGSFNPPLNSHLELAKQIIKNLNYIKKIIFVPVSTKYNKKEHFCLRSYISCDTKCIHPIIPYFPAKCSFPYLQ